MNVEFPEFSENNVVAPEPTEQLVRREADNITLAMCAAGIEVYEKANCDSEAVDVLYKVYAAMRAQQIIEEGEIPLAASAT